MPIRARCGRCCRMGLFHRVGPAEGRAIARAMFAILPARRRATPSIPPLRLRWPTRANVLIMMFCPYTWRASKLMKRDGLWRGDRYAHDELKYLCCGVKCTFPPEIAQTRYYHPTNRGLEGQGGEKLTGWRREQDQIAHKNATASVNVAVRLSLI